MDLQPSKAIQAKNRGNGMNLFLGGLKTRKGDPGKNGMMKNKQKQTYKKH